MAATHLWGGTLRGSGDHRPGGSAGNPYTALVRFFAGLVLVLAPACIAHASDWRYDVIHLRNGEQFKGLIVSETKDNIQFKYVIRRPGYRTSVFATVFDKDEIDRIDRLNEEDRAELRRRLEQLDPGGKRERARMRAVPLAKISWPENQPAFRYQGWFFVLESNADEPLVRLVIVRLESIFKAFVDHLGTRRRPEKLIRIILYDSMEDYRRHARQAGLDILNPAYYDPVRNQINAASNLGPWAQDLARLRRKHDRLLLKLEEQERLLRRHFHGRPPRAMINQIRQTRRSVQRINYENEATYDRLKRPLFATLYHEAFHAYLDNFVYSRKQGSVPLWLNEGLAQVFETAVVESNELRVGHIDPKRLSAVQEAIRRNRLVPLRDLLHSQPMHFRVAHRSEALASNRYFLAAWALAYYLTFSRQLLEDDRLDAYVQAQRRGLTPEEAFRDLVGQPLSQFDEAFRHHMLNLNPDGSLRKAVRPRAIPAMR